VGSAAMDPLLYVFAQQKEQARLEIQALCGAQKDKNTTRGCFLHGFRDPGPCQPLKILPWSRPRASRTGAGVKFLCRLGWALSIEPYPPCCWNEESGRATNIPTGGAGLERTTLPNLPIYLGGVLPIAPQCRGPPFRRLSPPANDDLREGLDGDWV